MQVWRVVVGRDVPNVALDVTLGILGLAVGMLMVQLTLMATGIVENWTNAASLIGGVVVVVINLVSEIAFPSAGWTNVDKMAAPGRMVIAVVAVAVGAVIVGVLNVHLGLFRTLSRFARPGLDDRLSDWSIKTMTAAWGSLLALGVLIWVFVTVLLVFALYWCIAVALKHTVAAETFWTITVCVVGGLAWMGLLWTTSTAIVGNGNLFVMVCAAFTAAVSAAIGWPIRVALTGMYGAGVRLVSPVLRFRCRRLAQRSGVPRATIRQ